MSISNADVRSRIGAGVVGEKRITVRYGFIVQHLPSVAMQIVLVVTSTVSMIQGVDRLSSQALVYQLQQSLLSRHNNHQAYSPSPTSPPSPSPATAFWPTICQYPLTSSRISTPFRRANSCQSNNGCHHFLVVTQVRYGLFKPYI